MKRSSKKKLYWDFGKAGFGSGFNLLVIAYLYAKKNGLKFVLFSKHSSISYCNGFTDYFLPFAEPEKNETILFPSISFRFPNDNLSIFMRAVVFALRRVHLLCKERKFNVLISENMIHWIWNPNFLTSNELEEYRGVAKKIWQFNPETQQFCDEKTKALDLPGSYACLHIRRGDKIAEISRPFPSISEYMAQAQKRDVELKTFFVMTDDYAAFEELKKEYPNLNFYTLAKKEMVGHEQNKFNSGAKEKIRLDVLHLLTEIEIAKKADFVVGTESSNIYRLIGLFKDAESLTSVDTCRVAFY